MRWTDLGNARETDVGANAPPNGPARSSSPWWRTSVPFTLVAGLLCAAGLFLWLQHSPPLPDARLDGAGLQVTLVLFSDNGTRGETIHVHKLLGTDDEWRQRLTADQFNITRRKGTEFSFHNLYWNEHRPGVYRCVCCGNALFRSQDKFDSDTGWPSFWAPIAEENITIDKDLSANMQRTEVRCTKCDAHLGHVFDDGPPPTGLRYCMNSTALRLVQSK